MIKNEIKCKHSNSYVRTINHEYWQPGSERKATNAPSFKRDISPARGKLRVASRSVAMTLSPGRERIKIGSPAVRAKLARDLRMVRLLDRTAGKLGNVIANRIATPKRMNDVAHFTGETLTPKGNRVSLSKLTVNPVAGMMKTAPGANGNFPARFVSRKDVVLSFHDRQEVVSAVRSVLAVALHTGEWHGERIEKGSPLFKAFYRHSRDALGMHKIQSKLVDYDAPFGDRLSLDVELASDSLEESASVQAEQSAIEKLGEHFRECIEAKYQHDRAGKVHKCYTAYKRMLSLVSLAQSIALGETVGHGAASKQSLRNMVAKFRLCVAEGEALLGMTPERIASELQESFDARMIE